MHKDFRAFLKHLGKFGLWVVGLPCLFLMWCASGILSALLWVLWFVPWLIVTLNNHVGWRFLWFVDRARKACLWVIFLAWLWLLGQSSYVWFSAVLGLLK